jgi:DNA-binding GntR family transcriptional regulator
MSEPRLPRSTEPLRRVERPVRLADRAYEEIRAALLGGGSLSLERIGEEELARELSMSRTPVREALQRLTMRELLEPASGGGYDRRRTTPRGVLEHCELRLLLEPPAAARAAELGAYQNGLAERVSGLDPARPADEAAFHLAIAEATGGEALAEMVGRLGDLAALDRARLGNNERAADASRHAHASILAAIEAGETEAARAAMAAHLEQVRDSMMADLGRGEPDA